MLQACDEPEPDGISDIRHHYGNRVGCLLQELDGWGGRLAASQCPTSRDFVPWRFFGRRPPQRVEGFVMPASKNQNKTGSRRLYSITWSASNWSELGTVRPRAVA